MVELLGGSDLEAADGHALWIDAAHHVPDRPSLPAESRPWMASRTPHVSWAANRAWYSASSSFPSSSGSTSFFFLMRL